MREKLVITSDSKVSVYIQLVKYNEKNVCRKKLMSKYGWR